MELAWPSFPAQKPCTMYYGLNDRGLSLKNTQKHSVISTQEKIT